MALILLIESATEVCSVCLAKDGKIQGMRETSDEKSHATRLALFVDELLKEAEISARDLDAVAISMGPGSYTGLRIGVSLAKGIGYAASIPLIAISTLESLANQALNHLTLTNTDLTDTSCIVPMIDARRMEVYCAVYNKNLQEIKATEALILEENSFFEALNKGKVYFAGNGAFKTKELITHPNAFILEGVELSATGMIDAAEKKFNAGAFENLAYFEPYYLKDFVATLPKNKVIPGL
jgi:tRNA threonylcarbamoyladenosine biosynthesis protein TsaB